MTAIATPFGSSEGRYKFSGSAGLVNCYAELSKQNKAKYNIVPSDGLVAFATVTDTPCRGAIFLEDLDYVYSVHSGSVFQVDVAGTPTRLGTIPGQDRVRIARNKKSTPQTVIQCATGVYIVEGGAVSKLVSDVLPTVIDVAENDGYIIYLTADKYYISSINEATAIDGLDFADVLSSPDKNVGCYVYAGYLWLFGQRTIEIHKDTGNADFPFEPMPTVLPRGLMSKFSIAPCDNTLMFIGDDGIVYRLQGFSAPGRISNHQVERSIQGDASQSSIFAFSWSRGGHAFYSITGSNWTWTYDAATKEWHKRQSYGLDIWRTTAAVHSWNYVLMGDSIGGKLFYLDQNTFTEENGTMIAEITFPPLHVFPNGGIVDSLFLDYVVGQGVTSTTSQGYNPKIMLDYSDDGGNTFVSERQVNTGKQGVYQTRVFTRRLGRFETTGRVFRVRQSDPVPRALALADVKVRPLKK